MAEIVSNGTLTELKALMGERYGKLVDLYITNAGGLTAQLRDGLARGDLAAIRDAAHALRSSSGHMGLTGIAECALEIENIGREAETFEDVSEKIGPLVAAILSDYEEGCVILKASL